jgi:hypothetical protein
MKRTNVTLTIIFALGVAACSPYVSQMKRLDTDYRAGRIPTKDYYAIRSQMMQGDALWRANFAASMNAAAANLNQTAANINQQNAINAYNARTRVYAQPTFYSPGSRYYQVTPMGGNTYQVRGGGGIPIYP